MTNSIGVPGSGQQESLQAGSVASVTASACVVGGGGVGPAGLSGGPSGIGVSVIPLCVSKGETGHSGPNLPLFCGVDTFVAMTNIDFPSASWLVLSRWLENGRSRASFEPSRVFEDTDTSGHPVTHYCGAGAGLHNWYYHVSLCGAHVWLSRQVDNGNVPNTRIKCEASALAADGPEGVWGRVLQAVLCWGSSGHDGERVAEVHVACDFLLPGFAYQDFMNAAVSASVAGLEHSYLNTGGCTVYLGQRGGPREWCVYGKGARVMRGEDNLEWAVRWGVNQGVPIADVVRFEVRLRRQVFRQYPGTVLDTLRSLRGILADAAWGRVCFGDAYRTLQASICEAFGRFDGSVGLGKLPYRSGAKLDASQYLENRLLPALVGYSDRVGVRGLYALLQVLADALSADEDLRGKLQDGGVRVEDL